MVRNSEQPLIPGHGKVAMCIAVSVWMTSSLCPRGSDIEIALGKLSLVKQAPVVSYGE